jgi:hypothetical protein
LHPFADLDGPRSDPPKLHTLLDLTALSLGAVVSGAEGGAEVEAYGSEKPDWLETFRDLPNGIPAHDTIGRGFGTMDAAAFPQCFLSGMHAVVGVASGKLIASDGPTRRRSFDTAGGQSARHRVSAWARANYLLLDLQGALGTIGALGCQKRISEEPAPAAPTPCWRSRKASRPGTLRCRAFSWMRWRRASRVWRTATLTPRKEPTAAPKGARTTSLRCRKNWRASFRS